MEADARPTDDAKPTGDAWSWTAYPARERPLAAVATLAVIGGAGAAVGLSSESWLAGMAGSLLVIAGLHRFFFPSRFSVDRERVRARYLFSRQELPWREVRRLTSDDHGAYLGTRAASSRLDPYRGMHVLFGRHRDRVLKTLRAHLPSISSAGTVPPQTIDDDSTHHNPSSDIPAGNNPSEDTPES